ncbi:retrovirus-related Pol polyprotein from transposon 17.6 [Trichonephila clavipes]|nr:retrovirus-related Pol polyprotein from transposon 17.6 [Trichonephila clavipes]
MRIILKDEEPVCQPPRRLAFTERQEVNKQIEGWLNEGIIRPSSAEYASPIVMVKKKVGSSRMCIDYRKLNQKLVKDQFPLPIIEDVLDTLQEAKRSYSERNCVISYLDDLVIPAKNEQEGLEKLKIIFEVAKKYGLEIRLKKCQFLKKKIEFLGHIVESGTIKPSPTKTLAVRKFPEPTTIKQVQSFLGLTGYFRMYIKDYSKIAKPLSDLTRKENLFVFFFGIQQKEAFEKLKKIMTEGPILHLYKYGRKTELHTDACKQGYGAILLQEAEDGKLHPVYYMSKKTNTAEEKYDSYELEKRCKKNIETLQSENRKTYNRRRKKASLYKEGDLVAIQRTQFGAGLKLRPKFLGPYKVTKVNSKDRYEVERLVSMKDRTQPPPQLI